MLDTKAFWCDSWLLVRVRFICGTTSQVVWVWRFNPLSAAWEEARFVSVLSPHQMKFRCGEASLYGANCLRSERSVGPLIGGGLIKLFPPRWPLWFPLYADS